MFFFQAEEGKRDLVRSRGRGDVYKSQAQLIPHRQFRAVPGRNRCDDDIDRRIHQARVPVSFTHLTLPTSDLV